MPNTTLPYLTGFTTYHLALALSLLVLLTIWAVGASLGSHKIERLATRGLLLLAICIAAVWAFWGIPPLPESFLRALR